MNRADRKLVEEFFISAWTSFFLLTSCTLTTATVTVHCKRNIDIFGWYSIDWGSKYYPSDFSLIKNMSIDGVFLTSSEFAFIANPNAYRDAITQAQSQGLQVGILIFHPYSALLQDGWGLPVRQDEFADFSSNTTWIETTYTTKLQNIVANYSGIRYYVFDDMTFSEASNQTNAQFFIDRTFQICNGTALMLSYYPPKNLTAYIDLNIPNWDWYTAPEDLGNINESLTKKPSGNKSLGQFVWLYQRTTISFEHLQEVYSVLADADRIEIFALRYGSQTWTDGISNSILENSQLVKSLASLNLDVKSEELNEMHHLVAAISLLFIAVALVFHHRNVHAHDIGASI